MFEYFKWQYFDTCDAVSEGGSAVLKEVSRQLLSEAAVMCFDELQVTDIADAMVLRTLFEYLFEGIIVNHSIHMKKLLEHWSLTFSLVISPN